MPLLLKILGVKAIGTLIGIIIMLTRSAPAFTKPDIFEADDSLRAVTTLTKCFSEGLDDIITSGSEVGIFYFCTLLAKDADGSVTTLVEKRTYQYISYSPADDIFNVSVSMDSSSAYDDMEEAKIAISTLNLGLVPSNSIDQYFSYSIRLEAALNTIEIEAIDAEQFDLNAFWNYKYPELHSDWISGEEVLAR
jgi:hypothetical protein